MLSLALDGVRSSSSYVLRVPFLRLCIVSRYMCLVVVVVYLWCLSLGSVRCNSPCSCPFTIPRM
jgi:hypothetical protein